MSADGGAVAERAPKRVGNTDPRPDTLWHTPSGDAWATVSGWHFPVLSDRFKQWLAGRLYECEGTAPGRHRPDELALALAAEAIFRGPEHCVHLRMAEHDGAVWLDLADKKGRAIRIGPEGWCVAAAADVPVKFYRPPNMRPLPEPLRDEADTNLLAELLNLRDDDTRRLVLTWLAFTLRPKQPYPVLAVSGPPGSAKSSLAAVLRNLVDPSEVALVGQPHGADLVALAKNNAILCFDNLSGLTPALADDLCRLATGGGLGGRKLYTNDGDATFNASRPLIMNGISDVATRGDLADRALLVRVPKIEDGERRTAAEMREAFDYAHPRILAGLLDMAAMGLRRHDDVTRKRLPLPRMADFALWGLAVAPLLGWTEEDFVRAHRVNRMAAFDAAIEDDAVAPLVIALVYTQPGKVWQGTSAKLWEKLMAGFGAVVPKGFPASPAAFGKNLKRIEPALAARGIDMESAHGRGGMQIVLRATDP